MPKTKKVTSSLVGDQAAAPSPNQLVAYNLVRARELRGWTQERAAQELSLWTGVRWSKASWSAAERSVDGVRVREFTADDIAAFSHTFGVPVGWWFAPPTDDRLPMDDTTRMGYVQLQLGEPDGVDAFRERVSELSVAIEGRDLEDLAGMIVTNVLQTALAKQSNQKLGAVRDSLERLLSDIDAVVAKSNEGA